MGNMTKDNIEHFKSLNNDMWYFVNSFTTLAIREMENRSRFKVEYNDDLDDLKAETILILCNLFNKWKVIVKKYDKESDLDKYKIMQKYVKSCLSNHMFNWWMKNKSIKMVSKNKLKRKCPPIGTETYVRVIYNENDHGNIINHFFINKTNSKDRLINLFEEKMISKIDNDIVWKDLKSVVNALHYKAYFLFYKENMSYLDISQRINKSVGQTQNIIWRINSVTTRKMKQKYMGRIV